jgi:ribosomal protein L21E
MFLRCCIHDSPKKWKSWLPLAKFWYNTSFHSSLGCSPFKVLYGYDPVIAAAPILPVIDNKSMEELLADRQVHTTLIKSNLTKAHDRIKIQADKSRTEREFQVGDEVLLKLQPYTQSSMANKPYPKISLKFYGPYKILTKVGKVAYKELPQDNLIHPIFHVSQLKAFTPDYKPVFSKLLNTIDFSQVVSNQKLFWKAAW